MSLSWLEKWKEKDKKTSLVNFNTFNFYEKIILNLFKSGAIIKQNVN